MPTLADLQFYIAGETFSEVFQPEWTTCDWKQIYKVWYSGSNTHVTISLLNHCAVAYGNDFAVDDLSFRPLCVAHDEVTIDVNLPTTAEQTVTADDAYTWHGTEYKASGDYEWKTTNVAGCDSIETLHLTIRPTQPTYSDITVVECESYTWNGKTYTSSGIYSHTITNGAVAGNDSIIRLHLTIVQTEYQKITDKVCDTELPYRWTTYRTQTITQAGSYTDTLLSQKGCDSIVYMLSLDVKSEQMVVTPTITTETCTDDDAVVITVSSASDAPLTYDLTFAPQAVAQGFVNLSNEPVPATGIISVSIPQGADSTQYVRPDDYSLTLTLRDDCGHTVDYPLSFRLLYPAWLIQQRWRDVMALYNTQYNGGYDFSIIRWYLDGNEVQGQGEHNGYLYMSPRLQPGTYWVQLTRRDDGKTIRTCGVEPNLMLPYYLPPAEKVRLRPQTNTNLRHVLIETECSGRYMVYDVTGKQMQQGWFGVAYGVKEIRLAPTTADGTYLLHFLTDDGEEEVKKWIVH